MKVSVVHEDDGEVFAVEVSGETRAQDITAMYGSGFVLYGGGRELAAEDSLAALGDDAVVILRARQLSTAPPAQQVSHIDVNETPSPDRHAQIEEARQTLLAQPALLERMRAVNPALAAASSSPAHFARLMEHERVRLVRQANAAAGTAHASDEMSPEAQRRIEDAIRRQNVAENMGRALAEHPQSFGSVHMLYVRAEINGAPVRAFVDCGAQATIMSAAAARRVRIAHLVDERFSGVASGVGRSRILGRVHSVQMAFVSTRRASDGGDAGPLYTMASISVIEEGEGAVPDVLLGLDMLRSLLASVDLARDALVIGDRLVPFLPPSECPSTIASD